MYGKTFILVKPDGIELNLIDKIIQKIKEKDISVIKQEDIFLNTSDILNLWPYTQSDIVSRQLFLNYLLGKRCILLQLESSKSSLYEDISEIKKNFRKKYGHHQFLSVMHTPGDHKEYIKDVKVFERKMEGIIPNKTIIGSFKCYVDLDKYNLINLCQKIQLHMNIDHRKLIQEIGTDKSFLIACKNGINDSCFLVGILCDYLRYSFELSYYLAFSVNYYMHFPIMLLKNTDYNIAEIRGVLEKYAYKTMIMKGDEYLNGETEKT